MTPPGAQVDGHNSTDAMALPQEIVKRMLGAVVKLRRRLTFSVGRTLGPQNVHFADFGSLCEKVGRLDHQCGGDFAGEMSLATRFVVERIEDSESRGPHAQGVPRDGPLLFFHQGYSTLEELL